MSTIVSTVLIATPPAFLTGWILSKVVFRHISLTRPNAAPGAAFPVPVAARTNDVASDSGRAGPISSAASADARKVNGLRQKLAGALGESQSLQSEIQLLKEAAAEREHTVLELKRKLQVQLKVPEESMRSAPAKQKQFIQMMEGRLATQQHCIDELGHELEVANTRAKRAAQRFGKWRRKFKPMARQFRQQRRIVNELREELRQRDLQQQKLAAARSPVAKPATPTLAATGPSQTLALAETSKVPADSSLATGTMTARVSAQDLASAGASKQSPDYGDGEREDLQALRGIGPALHKKLNEKGIYRLQQLAFMSSQELNNLGRSLGLSNKRLARHDWTQQARQLLNMPELSTGEKIEA